MVVGGVASVVVVAGAASGGDVLVELTGAGVVSDAGGGVDLVVVTGTVVDVAGSGGAGTVVVATAVALPPLAAAVAGGESSADAGGAARVPPRVMARISALMSAPACLFERLMTTLQRDSDARTVGRALSHCSPRATEYHRPRPPLEPRKSRRNQ
jgi:hypothetical protein